MITITLVPSATCASCDRDLGHRAVDGRNKRVLHLHRLDDGEAMPRVTFAPCSTRNASTLPCMGARTSPPALDPQLHRGEIAQADYGLAAMAQHIDRRARTSANAPAPVFGRDRNDGAVRSKHDLGHGLFAVGQNRQRQAARAGQLEPVGGIPGRARLVGGAIECGRDARMLLRQKFLRAERCGGAVEALASAGTSSARCDR